jgi:hypothetical protein
MNSLFGAAMTVGEAPRKARGKATCSGEILRLSPLCSNTQSPGFIPRLRLEKREQMS